MFRLKLPRLTIAIKFTREGLIFVLLSLAIGAAAVNTGNNILYLIVSLMLGFIIVSGMVSRRMLQGLRTEVLFPDHLFVGNSAVSYVSISNGKKLLPSLGIRFCIDQPLFPKTEHHFFYIPAKETIKSFVSLKFPRRGIFSLQELELQTRFPFSFFIKIRRYKVDQQVKVYPALFRISEQMMAKAAEGSTVDSPYRGESHQLLHLRDYTAFDSTKRIHWKASAKLEKLLVKEYQREQGRDLRLYYDVYPAGSEDEDRQVFERAISLIGSFGFLLFEKGIRGKICFADREFEITNLAGSFVALLDYLSVLAAGNVPAFQTRSNSSGEILNLLLRSKRIPSAAASSISPDRILWLEDWLPLLQSPLETTGKLS